MAVKKITKGGTYNININKNSKDMVYVLKDSSLASSVTLNFTRATGYGKYSSLYKLGNDLVVTTVYDEKLITNTIRDYFLYDTNYPVSLTNPNLVKVKNTEIFPYEIQESYARGLFFHAKTGTILGSKESDTYLISKNVEGSVELQDFGGNDNYNILAKYQGQSYLNLTDYSGNDIYDMSNSTKVKIEDKKGNDIYGARNAVSVEINDEKGNDKYSADYTKTVIITDSEGKDTYEINASGDVNSKITDNAGNDKYLLLNGAKIFQITDESGNDNYEYVSASNDTAYIKDKAGNDNYNLSIVNNKTIYETKGNDKYNLYNNQSISISDDAGNDNYTANASNYLYVGDKTGNDKYNISNSDHLIIKEGEEGYKKGGNDIYNLNNVKQVNLSSENNQYNITDYAGKDSYNITNGSEIRINDKNTDKKTSADKYDISANSQARIFDDAGNDLYKINASVTNITDKLGDDKYIFTDGKNFFNADVSANSVITDESGNDSYELSNTKVNKLTDKKGKDTYTISSNSIASIEDESDSNDTYKINGMNNFVVIDDEKGKDKLTLQGTNRDNLICMVDYENDSNSHPGAVYSGNLIIFDKTSNGFVEIKNYFKMESSYIKYTDSSRTKASTNDGCIEAIYAGKSNVSSSIFEQLSGVNVDAISADVANWLKGEGHKYASVSKLVESENTVNIANFIATFTKQ